MNVNFHNPKAAEAEIMHSTKHGPFCTLDFRSEDGEVTLFLRDHQMNAARAIACDLTGKDLNEALRERREAEDAA